MVNMTGVTKYALSLIVQKNFAFSGISSGRRIYYIFQFKTITAAIPRIIPIFCGRESFSL